MKTIPLTQDQFALVDDADYEWLSQWKWTAAWNRGTRTFYAIRYSAGGRIGRKRIFMHRQILGLEFGDKRKGDHRFGNTLDNRREFLRIATDSQNTTNSRLSKRNTSGVKGVRWNKREESWCSSISVNRVRRFLGYFPTKQQAVDAYRTAAMELHGEFTRLSNAR